jgi:hypothetical protein
MSAPRSLVPCPLVAALLCAAACAVSEAADSGHLLALSAYPDSVLQCDPNWGGGCTPTNPNFMDPQVALGAPDYSGGSNGTGALALGSGGLVRLGFAGARIANSGDASFDLRVIEVGGYSEASFVALRPALPTTPEILVDLGLADADGDGYFEIGRTTGNGSFDLDALFNRAVAPLEVRFDAVQIVDDIDDTTSCTTTPGADIDTVVALAAWVSVWERSWSDFKRLYRE